MGERDAIHADTGSRDGQQVVPSRRGRVARFAQLALALDDLLAAGSCLRLVSQSDASLPTQVRHALFSAMIVAYGRLFPHAGDEARGLPGSYEPEGQLRVPHLHLLGIRRSAHCSRAFARGSKRRPVSFSRTCSPVGPFLLVMSCWRTPD